MTLVLPLIILSAFIGLIIAGIVVNIYLYSSGAMSKRRLKAVDRMSAASVPGEGLVYVNLGLPDKLMDNTVRKVVFVLFGAMTLVSALLALALSIPYIAF